MFLASSTDVTTDEARRRLGDIVRAARERVGLTIDDAAAAAGMSPTTWGKVESGDGEVRRLTYAGVERALGWATDSVKTVLDGGDPTAAVPERRPRTAVPVAPIDHIAEWEESMIAEIWSAHPHLSDEQREELTRQVRVRAAEARVIQDRLRRASA